MQWNISSEFINGSSDAMLSSRSTMSGPVGPSASIMSNMETVHIIMIPIITAIGLIGNLSCGLILNLSKLKKLQLTVLTSACVFNDSLFLIGLLCTWLPRGTSSNPSNIHWCYFINMLTNCSTFICTWCSVAVLGHCCSALSSNRTKLWSKLVAKSIVLGISIASVVIYVNLTLTIDLQVYGTKALCMPIPSYISVVKILHKLDLLINTVLPYIISVVLILLIKRRLLIQSKTKDTQSNLKKVTIAQGSDDTPSRQPLIEASKTINTKALTFSDQQGKQKEMRNFARGIFYVFVTQLLFCLPSHMIRIVHTLRELMNIQQPLNTEQFLAQNISQYPLYISYAMKSYILFMLWRSYRTLTFKILKRGLLLAGLLLRCRNYSRAANVKVTWKEDLGSTIVSYPQIGIVQNATDL